MSVLPIALFISDASKRLVATENGIPALLILVQSSDLRVQRNAAGSLLNLTHIRTSPLP